MNPEQREFLIAEFLTAAVSATVQRGNPLVYRPGVGDRGRREFRRALRKQLSELAQQYNHPIDQATHIRNIETLAADLNRNFGEILDGDGHGFLIGRAQKALNLFLKYLWCLGEIACPPHCPFDSNVINHLPGWRGHRWTAVCNIDEYNALVVAARTAANGLSPAKWELRFFNEFQQGNR